jgi:hypothetical protein
LSEDNEEDELPPVRLTYAHHGFDLPVEEVLVLPLLVVVVSLLLSFVEVLLLQPAPPGPLFAVLPEYPPVLPLPPELVPDPLLLPLEPLDPLLPPGLLLLLLLLPGDELLLLSLLSLSTSDGDAAGGDAPGTI